MNRELINPRVGPLGTWRHFSSATIDIDGYCMDTNLYKGVKLR